MNIKIIKLLIGLFLAIICVFLGLIGLERFYSGKSGEEFSDGAMYENGLAKVSTGDDDKKAPPVSYRTGLSTESVSSEGAMMVVKNDEFEGVAEEPQSMMDMLADMSGSNKKKNPPIYLTDKDLDKKITVERPGKPGAPLSASAVPELGKSASLIGGKTMISAPVDYKIFRDPETWRAFASTHKGRFPPVDFSREAMLILVSVSDLPSGIFKIDGLKRSPKETVVLYRVDPLAMAVGNGEEEYAFYSAVAVPKLIDVKLEQIP